MYTYCILKGFLGKKRVERNLSWKLGGLSSLQFFNTIIDNTKFRACALVSLFIQLVACSTLGWLTFGIL